MTARDGTRYYYGAGKLPTAEGGTGVDPASNATWTQPVYCPNSGDPCYSSSTGVNSFAPNMAYRWNLDYAVDPHGNTTTFTYQTESNYYARSSAHVNTAYTRGGFLTQISYGLRTAGAAATSPAPAAKVVFTTAQRCTGSPSECASFANLTSTTKADWPDTPFDLICPSTGTCPNGAISYFSTYKLTQIQTLVNNAGTYKAVDTYALSSSFPDPGDTTSPSLWLDSVQHTGNDATTAASMPAVVFGGTLLPNRVPGSATWPAYNHQRLTWITTESGEQVSVTYANSTATIAACNQTPGSQVLPNPTNNTMLCYQQYWTPPGQSANSDWFIKYVVTQVTGTDLVAGSPARRNNYTYVGGAAWHRNDSPTTDNAQRTWNQFRGFGQVTTTTGVAPDPVTQTQTTYLRGMDGDYNSQTGGTQKSVTVSSTVGDVVTDSRQYAGMALESDTYDQSGGSVKAKSISLPWSAQTSSHAEASQPGLPAEKAFLVKTGTTKAVSLLASGAWRTTASISVFSSITGLLQHTDNQGDTSLLGTANSQETCSTSTYATPPSGLNSGMLDVPARSTTVSVSTGGPIGTGACPAPSATNTIADTLAYYDGNTTTAGVIGSVGDTTQSAVIDHYSGSTPVYQNTMTAGGYDAYGRPTSTTDAHGLVTTTGYTPAAGQLPATVVSTDTAHNFITTSTMDVARQTPTKVVDLNGNSTSTAYDGLGRVTGVWLPGQALTKPASIGYVYTVNGTTAPTTLLTKTLRDDATYATSYTIYDGYMAPRQQQDVSKDGTNNSLVTDTFYDSHGWVVKQTTPYYSGTGLPAATFVQTADSAVPAENLTTFDGRGRAVASTFYSYAQPQWHTTTAYPGADRTDVTPPAGGTAASAFTDALGRTTAKWSYTTATPTGNATDANVLTYTYTPAGKLASTTNQAGRVWSSTYDLRGNLTQSVDPDSGTTTAAYYPTGELKTTTDANNQTLAFAYDSLGRKTGEFQGSTAGPQIAAWTFDTATLGKGKPASSTSFVAGAAYTATVAGYTNRGVATGNSVTIPTVANGLPSDEGPLAGIYSTSSVVKPSGAVASTTFGADGGLPAETVNYSYNQNNVLTNFGGLVGYLATTQVDPFGRTTRWTLGAMPNQVVQTNIVDTATGRVTEQFLDKQSGSTHVDDVVNLYTASGRQTATTDVQHASLTDRQCFSYDQLGQLTAAWTDTAGTHTAASPSVPNIGGCDTVTPSSSTVGGPAAYWQTYQYNASGNRTSTVDKALDGVVAHDVNHNYSYTGTATQPDTLQSVVHSGPGTAGTDTYTYDAAGNTKTRTIAGGPNQTLSYDTRNHTSTVNDTAGNAATYIYDANGSLLLQRDHTATGTTVTLYLGAEQLTLTTGTGAVTGLRYYATNGGPTIVRSSTGALTYECGDSQGTHTVTIDAGSSQAETRRYFTPYGRNRGTAPTSWLDNRAFVNQATDPATGLNLLGARVYDPATGRFLQRDPVLLTDNAFTLSGYTYSANDPVNHSDAGGTRPTCDDADGVGQHACRVGEDGWYPPTGSSSSGSTPNPQPSSAPPGTPISGKSSGGSCTANTPAYCHAAGSNQKGVYGLLREFLSLEAAGCSATDTPGPNGSCVTTEYFRDGDAFTEGIRYHPYLTGVRMDLAKQIAAGQDHGDASLLYRKDGAMQKIAQFGMDAVGAATSGVFGSTPEQAFLGSFDLTWKVVGRDSSGSPVVEFNLVNATTKASGTPNPGKVSNYGSGLAGDGHDAVQGEHWLQQVVTWREPISVVQQPTFPPNNCPCPTPGPHP